MIATVNSHGSTYRTRKNALVRWLSSGVLSSIAKPRPITKCATTLTVVNTRVLRTAVKNTGSVSTCA
ncbi:hypothetical protein D3C72_2392010 [compost metagenome]